jgi:hypothetical protein
VGFGENTQAVRVLWFPGWWEAAQTATPSSLTVADVWDSVNNYWDTSTLQGIFYQHTVLQIQQLNFKPMEGIPNLTVWTTTNSGKYYVKTDYKTLRERGQQQSDPLTLFGLVFGLWT